MTATKKKILHIDDDQNLLKLSQRILDASGFDVETILRFNAETAVEWDQFDLVMVDWLMPEITGIEVCRLAREAGYKRALMIISSKELDSDERRAVSEVEAQHMAKPFGPHDLIGRVRECLSVSS